MRVHHKVEQNTLDWQMLRLAKPTASCFDQILTPKKLEPSKQRKPYMRRLNAEWIKGAPLEDEDYRSRWMDRGQEYEDQAVGAYELWAERETSPGGFWTLEVGGGETGCSPDRLVDKDGLVEIKCPLLSTQVAAALDGVEVDHVIQVQAQLWIADRAWCDVFSYHPALLLPAKRIQRDEELIAKLVKAVKEFVEEMLRERKDLEREHGPFLRNGEAPPEVDLIANPTFITEADLDEILRMRRER